MNFLTKYDFSHEMLIYETIMGDVTFYRDTTNDSILFSKQKGRLLFLNASFEYIQCSINDNFA